MAVCPSCGEENPHRFAYAGSAEPARGGTAAAELGVGKHHAPALDAPLVTRSPERMINAADVALLRTVLYIGASPERPTT
jgi:hypothetical protein